jgi:integrase
MQTKGTARFERTRVDKNLFLRGDGRYEVKWTDADGKYRSRTLGAKNLTEARRERDKLIVKRNDGHDITVCRKTLSEVASEYLASCEAKTKANPPQMAERTLELYKQRYETHLKPSLGTTHVQKLRLREVAQLKDDLLRGKLSGWTQLGILNLLSPIFEYAMECEYVTENPVRKLRNKPQAKNQTEARGLTKAEVKRLLVNLIDTYKAIITAAYYTAMRQSELLGLRWCDVDFQANLIRVEHQLSRAKVDEPAKLLPLKTEGSKRNIPLLPELRPVLLRERNDALREGCYGPDRFVFQTAEGTPLYYRNVSARGLDKAADRAELNGDDRQKLSFHDLRHTALTHLIKYSDADVHTIARFAGHSQPSMTLDKYAREFEERDSKADAAIAKGLSLVG